MGEENPFSFEHILETLCDGKTCHMFFPLWWKYIFNWVKHAYKQKRDTVANKHQSCNFSYYCTRLCCRCSIVLYIFEGHQVSTNSLRHQTEVHSIFTGYFLEVQHSNDFWPISTTSWPSSPHFMQRQKLMSSSVSNLSSSSHATWFSHCRSWCSLVV